MIIWIRINTQIAAKQTGESVEHPNKRGATGFRRSPLACMHSLSVGSPTEGLGSGGSPPPPDPNQTRRDEVS